MKIVLKILFLFLPLMGWSQPGGGGGLLIKYLCDQSGNEVDIEKSKHYQLTCFLLADTILLSKNVYSKLDNHFQNYQVDSVGYLPHYNDSTSMVKTRFNPTYKYKAIRFKAIGSCFSAFGAYYDNYRMMLSTATDTMVIDFIKIVGENPNGIQNGIDSLVFEPGYFQYKRKQIYKIHESQAALWEITTADLAAYGPLISADKREFKPFYSTEINELLVKVDDDIIELNHKIAALKKSTEWKLYNEAEQENALEPLMAKKNTKILQREFLIAEKKALLNRP